MCLYIRRLIFGGKKWKYIPVKTNSNDFIILLPVLLIGSAISHLKSSVPYTSFSLDILISI